MAAVNGLEGEADRLCVLLVQPVRHLAGFSLLELLAVSVLIREMFFLLSSVFRGKLNLSKCLKMFSEMQLFKVCSVHSAELPLLLFVIKYRERKKARFMNVNLALDDELHNSNN